MKSAQVDTGVIRFLFRVVWGKESCDEVRTGGHWCDTFPVLSGVGQGVT
jgi:hypothetical protein